MTRILVIGAHPDDCEYRCGGTAALWRRAGFDVKFLTLTSGNAGHYSKDRAALAARRLAEAEAAAGVIGCQWQVGPFDDGGLLPTLDAREFVIREVRLWKPDLVVTHRPNDYHPDHRYTSVTVQDASYMLTVPTICPETEHLAAMPVIAYLNDEFTKPNPLTPDVAVDIDGGMPLKLDMLHRHVSQFYEWLPYHEGVLDQVPADDAQRRQWLETHTRWPRASQIYAERFRDRLVALYGAERGRAVRFAEAFEWCEYGTPGGDAARCRFFPFTER